MAMGAPPKAVGRRVVARTLVLASMGVLGGLGAAMVLTRFLEAHLVEISATDPASFALAAVVQMAVAVVAVWIPARRAAAVNPVTALRFD